LNRTILAPVAARLPIVPAPSPNALVQPVTFFESFELGLNIRGFFLVLLTCRVHGTLRLVDGVLPSLALPLSGSQLLRAFTLTALLLFLESKSGLLIGHFVVTPLQVLGWLAARRLAACLLRTVVSGEISRQLGVLFEGPA
jgi:hypothetical protein